eukprot:5380048-Amphidinium_carterae.1
MTVKEDSLCGKLSNTSNSDFYLGGLGAKGAGAMVAKGKDHAALDALPMWHRLQSQFSKCPGHVALGRYPHSYVLYVL